jgi:hypothetical protein
MKFDVGDGTFALNHCSNFVTETGHFSLSETMNTKKLKMARS